MANLDTRLAPGRKLGPVLGDARVEVKFAAIEYVTQTGRDVPEYLGGFYVNGKVYFGLRIPYADSLLVGFKPSTTVTGLDSVSAADRPPALTLIHLSFDAMVGLAFLLLLAGLWALWTWHRRHGLPRQKWFWWLGIACGPAALVAMECGWIVTEVGRQPWVVFGLLKTSQSNSPNVSTADVIITLAGYIVIYGVLIAIGGWLMWREAKHGPDDPDSQPPGASGAADLILAY